MTRVVLKASIDRPEWAGQPDPNPDTLTFTTCDPTLEDVLHLCETFILGMGFHPPDGHLEYVDYPTDEGV